jgi:hypothetical protein
MMICAICAVLAIAELYTHSCWMTYNRAHPHTKQPAQIFHRLLVEALRRNSEPLFLETLDLLPIEHSMSLSQAINVVIRRPTTIQDPMRHPSERTENKAFAALESDIYVV